MAEAARLSKSTPAAKRRLPRRAARADQYSLPQRVDNSRLVQVADPRERHEQHRLLLVSMMLVAAILAAACQRFAIIRAGYQIEALKNQRELLLEANRQLRLEEASLRDPERIDAIARGQLGLNVPAPGQVVHLEQPAAEADSPVMARAQAPAGSQPLKAVLPAAAP